MVSRLRQQQKNLTDLRDLAGERWTENNLVFPNRFGNPLDPSNMRLEFNRILQEAGLPKIRFHDLRHTAASIMLNNGIPVIVVSRILGHSKPSVTLDIYGHLFIDGQAEAAELMERFTEIR